MAKKQKSDWVDKLFWNSRWVLIEEKYPEDAKFTETIVKEVVRRNIAKEKEKSYEECLKDMISILEDEGWNDGCVDDVTCAIISDLLHTKLKQK